MQKWEYRFLGPIKSVAGGFQGYYPYDGYFDDDGLKQTSLGGRKESDRIASTIAKLGFEGWEMIGCGSTGINGEGHIIYFKRPI